MRLIAPYHRFQRQIVYAYVRRGFPHHVIHTRSASTGVRFERSTKKIKNDTQETSWITSKEIAKLALFGVSDSSEGGLNIQIGGQSRCASPFFLRDACQCPSCVDPHSGQKKFNASDISPDIEVKSYALESGELHVTLSGKNGDSKSMSNHVARYTVLQLLRQLVPIRPRSPDPLLSLPGDLAHLLHPFDYSAFMQNDKYLETCMQQLLERGVFLLQNVPKSENSVANIGTRMAPLRQTSYGRTWKVKAEKQAANVANTVQALAPHADLLYMKDPPGFQLLHCRESKIEGGKSILVDGLAAAAHIKSQSLPAYKALLHRSMSWHYEVPNAGYFYDRKKIFLAQNLGYYNLALEDRPLQSVNWSPLFQAPLHVDRSTNYGVRASDELLGAMKLLSAYLEAERNQHRFRLLPGQCIIFNNRRMLHGRTAFNIDSGGSRLLQGAYLDTDEVWSRFTDLTYKLKGVKKDEAIPLGAWTQILDNLEPPSKEGASNKDRDAEKHEQGHTPIRQTNLLGKMPSELPPARTVKSKPSPNRTIESKPSLFRIVETDSKMPKRATAHYPAKSIVKIETADSPHVPRGVQTDADNALAHARRANQVAP